MFPGQTVFVTLDGKDFQMNEVTSWTRMFYSVKFNGPGVRYDVAIDIQSSEIVYWSGGDMAGKYNDLVLARRGIIPLLMPGENHG